MTVFKIWYFAAKSGWPFRYTHSLLNFSLKAMCYLSVSKTKYCRRELEDTQNSSSSQFQISFDGGKLPCFQ